MKDGKPWRTRREEELAQRAESKRQRIRRPAPQENQPAVPLKPGPRPKRPWPTVPPNHNPHEFRGITPWEPGPIWKDQIVCIWGGGPSLKTEKGRAVAAYLEATRDRCKVIAINNGYRRDEQTNFIGAPYADMLFFTDCQWWRWNHLHVTTKWKKDRLLVTTTSDTQHVTDAKAGREIKRMWRDRNDWSTDPKRVFGYDGGTQCMNLAAILGAKRIVLFGIDLQEGPKKETQYHSLHKRPTVANNYVAKFRPTMIEAVKQCQAMGIEVVRATPGFDIGAPLVSIEEALKPLVLDAGCLGDLMDVASDH